MSGSVGRIYLKNNRWFVTLQPHAALWFKRLFPKVSGAKVGTYEITNSPRVCADLEWFMFRYQVDLTPMEVLQRGAAAYRQQQRDLALMLESSYQPTSRELAIALRHYQSLAVDLHLQQHGILNGDDVGLGKTACAIGSFADERTLPAAVITYTHLQRQWASEVQKFLPTARCHVIKTRMPYDLKSRNGEVPDVIITTYAKLVDWADQLGMHCRSVTFDEIQELRREESAKYEAARKLARAMKFRLGLSATPIYNHGGEIFNVMDIIKPDCLGTAEEFHVEWCKGGGSNRSDWILADPSALGTYLRAEGLMLRRTRKDVGRELPPISKFTQVVDADETTLSRIQGPAAELARIILKQDAKKLSGIDQMQAASEFTNLLRRQTGIAKAPSVAAFVRVLVEEGEPVVLAGWHHAVYEIWRDLLKDLKPEFFTGQESPAQKQRARDRFCNRDTNLLILSLRSGVGLDGLQGHCRTVVIGELDWAPAVHKQFIGRVHRDGQKEPVFAYFLVANSGCDPIMVQTLGLKAEQAVGIEDPTAANEPELLDGVAQDRIEQMARDYLSRMAG